MLTKTLSLFFFQLTTTTMTTTGVVHSLSQPKPSQSPSSYNYFAFGSNMCLSTMKSLRNIDPIAAIPAILPSHELMFNVPGVQFVEPSWASVEPTTTTTTNDDDNNNNENTNVVHGVLYKLTPSDFVSMCRTEGVPFAYTLHRCRPIPYKADGIDAGEQTLTKYLNNNKKKENNKDNDVFSVPAYTLRASTISQNNNGNNNNNNIAPSQSYLNVLIRGAKEFNLDRSYIQKLESIEPNKNVVYSNGGVGFAENMLLQAERRRRQ